MRVAYIAFSNGQLLLLTHAISCGLDNDFVLNSMLYPIRPTANFCCESIARKAPLDTSIKEFVPTIAQVSRYSC